MSGDRLRSIENKKVSFGSKTTTTTTTTTNKSIHTSFAIMEKWKMSMRANENNYLKRLS